MKWFHFLIIQLLLIAIVSGVILIHNDKVNLIKSPPDSLSQWYKPANKRQVWLHNMFKLRRELQAIELYASLDDSEHLSKWFNLFSEHYLKIAEMVPEWKRKVDFAALNNLKKAVDENINVSAAVDEITSSCTSCHDDFRSITATIYRSPDFSTVAEIKSSVSMKDHMKTMTEQINLIKIASEDGMLDLALKNASDLKDNMTLLGETCLTCHDKDPKTYPNDEMIETLESLDKSLSSGTLKDQGRYLGTLAVQACARCHGSHRIVYDAKDLLIREQSWLDLLSH